MCSVDGCERESAARHLCTRHYQAAAKRGELPPKMRPAVSSCAVEGCERPGPYRKGWCSMHRQRIRAHGHADVLTRDERFDAKWQLDPRTGCHVWTAGTREGGYGWFRDDRLSRAAHIYAWERKNGPVPRGLVLDHYVCDRPICCNPDHVRIETIGGNVLRGTGPSAVNARKERCIRDHDLTDEANIYRPPRNPHFRQCRECIRIRSRRRSA